MKIRLTEETRVVVEEVVATFGDAQLIRAGGRMELRGGSMSDRTEALEWLSLFLPDEVPSLKK